MIKSEIIYGAFISLLKLMAHQLRRRQNEHEAINTLYFLCMQYAHNLSI